MKIAIIVLITMVGVFWVLNLAVANESSPAIVGMVGMNPVTEQSCAAIWLPVEEGKAVTGVLWYNNDSEVVFPEILLASGEQELVVDTSEAFIVATNVVGPEQGWGEITFDQPYACLSEGLYCVFMIPVGAEFQEPGVGMALGYCEADQGQCGWLGGAEDTWIKVGGNYSLAIEPIVVDAEEGMAFMKSIPSNGLPLLRAPVLKGAHPNPFNPQTVLQYYIPKGMKVDLAVFDVRGQCVRRLVSGQQEQGDHSVSWFGDNENGARVASGMYFARFVAGSIVQSQRLLLVK